MEELLAWSPRNPYLAALAPCWPTAVKSQTVVIPYALIATAVGLVFDLPAALAVNTLGSAVCISVPYFTGRSSDGVLVDGLMERYPRIGEVYGANRDRLFLGLPGAEGGQPLQRFAGAVLRLAGDALLGVLLSSFVGILPAWCSTRCWGTTWTPLSPPVLVCFAVDVLCIIASWLALRGKRRKGKMGTEKKTRRELRRERRERRREVRRGALRRKMREEPGAFWTYVILRTIVILILIAA